MMSDPQRSERSDGRDAARAGMPEGPSPGDAGATVDFVPAGRPAEIPVDRIDFGSVIVPEAIERRPDLSAPRTKWPTVPGYEILAEVGRGGMGVVYKARQVRLNRTVALKMILAAEYAGADAVARFLAEAQIVARLRHPNIVRVHAIGDSDGRPFVELEYLEGGSLSSQLDGTPWARRAAARLIETLAQALAEAHRMGIVHRDLKPANILMTEDGTPKIADFGLAKSSDEDLGLTRTNSIMGSPSYMAPEQAEGRARDVGPAADIYALGAVLYELLTGRPPFVGSNVLATLDMVRHAEPVPPRHLQPGISPDLETICLKCLRKEPDHRYASADALAVDLERYLAGEPILARPAPRWRRAWNQARRRPATAAVMAVAVLSTLAAPGLGSWPLAELFRRPVAAPRIIEDTPDDAERTAVRRPAVRVPSRHSDSPVGGRRRRPDRRVRRSPRLCHHEGHLGSRPIAGWRE